MVTAGRITGCRTPINQQVRPHSSPIQPDCHTRPLPHPRSRYHQLPHMSLQVSEHSHEQLRQEVELMVAVPQLQLHEQNVLHGGLGSLQVPEEVQV